MRSHLSWLVGLAVCLLFNVSYLHADDAEIAVLIKGMANPYWKSLHDGVIDKAKELGINVYIQGSDTDSDAEAQLNLCSTMLLRRPKALIFGAVNSINLAPCLREASKLGIQLVAVDGGTGKADAEKMGIRLNFSVASDNYELGRKAAAYLSGKRGEVLLIEGLPGNVPGELRRKGFVENLPDGLKVVASQPGDWDRLKAADITNAVITRYPNLAAVFAANDLMALGAAEALSARNMKGITVIGIDGIGDAVKAIMADRLTVSVAQLPYLMGSEAVEKTYYFIKGKATYEFNQSVPVVTLDKNVLTKKDEPLLKFVR